MAEHGGARPGAGRKKGYRSKRTIDILEAKRQAVNQILSRIQPIMEAQIRLATGEYYIERTDGERKIIYKAIPNATALKDVQEFVYGKAKTPVELSGDIGTPDIKVGLEAVAEGIRSILEKK